MESHSQDKLSRITNGLISVQEALADLILQHRDCDSELIAALGIGECST